MGGFCYRIGYLHLYDNVVHLFYMRSAITISIPETMKHDIEKEVKLKGYATTSELFRDLWRTWKKNELISAVKKSDKEFISGKGKVLKSLRDLR